MKANTAESSSQNSVTNSHGGTFAKVLDGRKRPVRGLWVRNGRYYAQLRFEDEATGGTKTRRVPLLKDDKPVETVPQAIEAMNALKVKRTEDNLPVLRRTPKFKDYVPVYIRFLRAGDGQKAGDTIDKEESILEGWAESIGGTHLDKIRRSHVNAYIAKRLEAHKSRRTVNLDVIALNQCLKHAVSEGWLKVLPTANLKPLKVEQKKRDLFTAESLEALCAAALGKKPDGSPVTKNGQQFCDYIRLMAYSGTRRNEALALKWEDVDFDRGLLNVSKQVKAKGQLRPLKGKEVRQVDFNAKLRAHLEDMKDRQHGVSDWLFPSPQRGAKDIPAQTFRESLALASDNSGLKNVGFHDMRHHFISYAVMSGVDFMTIAKWVGHKDGGVLIGKVYGHLADEHRKQMAEKLNFGPVVLKAVSA